MEKLQELNKEIDSYLDNQLELYNDGKLNIENYYSGLKEMADKWDGYIYNISISNDAKEQLCDCYIKAKINDIREIAKDQFLTVKSEVYHHDLIKMEIEHAKSRNKSTERQTGIEDIPSMSDEKANDELIENCISLALDAGLKMESKGHCQSDIVNPTTTPNININNNFLHH